MTLRSFGLFLTQHPQMEVQGFHLLVLAACSPPPQPDLPEVAHHTAAELCVGDTPWLLCKKGKKVNSKSSPVATVFSFKCMMGGGGGA